ncbi:glycosyltransferase family 2 protein [Candidatus Parcubacteria bacterium]|jgi:glycosyltransferase involved in cell wall biosynthesis|nr:MAG: glycosyltransferase family 2 protein [Candidatus Parcubacteria bacterium]
MPNKVSVILPAHNESTRIAEVVKEVLTLVDEVVVVDDGSSDDTAAKAKTAGAIVAKHRVNLGKGAALRTGAEAALLRGAGIIVLMDADGQHPASEIPNLIKSIQEDKADMTFAYRSLDRSMPFYRRLGNNVLNQTTRILFGLSLTDIWCGFRAFRAEIYENIKWQKVNYSADVEMALRLAQHKYRYNQIPIPTIYHEIYKGVSIIDGLKLLFSLLIWRVTL